MAASLVSLTFLMKMCDDGRNETRCSATLSVPPEVPVNTKVRYGQCKHDLPHSRGMEAALRADERRTLGHGEPWRPPVFYQSKPHRKAGARINVHMNSGLTLPSFGIKDQENAIVAERDVVPDRADQTTFVDLIKAREAEELLRARTGNANILVRACQDA
ncbi:hypothetical protein JHW43_009258 [Diplocarpon mali]|nr:hypothetical protein JHW43_009258 [Diplocarpon mali]